MECNIRDVTSGVPQKACWGEFSIVIYGNMAYVQTAAASRTGEIPSYLDTVLEFQHWPFTVGTLEGAGREFAPASLLRHPRRDVTYSAHILMLVGKVYCTSELNIHESGLNIVFFGVSDCKICCTFSFFSCPGELVAQFKFTVLLMPNGPQR